MTRGAPGRLPGTDDMAKNANAFSDKLSKRLSMLRSNDEAGMEEIFHEASHGMVRGLVDPDLKDRLMGDVLFRTYAVNMAKPIPEIAGRSDQWFVDSLKRERQDFDLAGEQVARYGRGPYDSFESMSEIAREAARITDVTSNKMLAAEETSAWLQSRLYALDRMDEDYAAGKPLDSPSQLQDGTFSVAAGCLMRGTVNDAERDALLARADFREYAANIVRIRDMPEGKRSMAENDALARFESAQPPFPEHGPEGPVWNSRMGLDGILEAASGAKQTAPLFDYDAPVTKPLNAGFHWEDFGDGSGHMLTDKGLSLFSYDEATREIFDPRTGWESMQGDWRNQAERVFEKYVRPREDLYCEGRAKGLYYPFFAGSDFTRDKEKADYIAITRKYALSAADFNGILGQIRDAEDANHSDHTIGANDAVKRISGAYLGTRSGGPAELGYEGVRIALPMDRFVRIADVMAGKAPAQPARQMPREGLPDVGRGGVTEDLGQSLMVD